MPAPSLWMRGRRGCRSWLESRRAPSRPGFAHRERFAAPSRARPSSRLDQMPDDLGSVEVSEHGRRECFSKSLFHHGARVLATAAVAAARIASVARLLRLLDDHRAAANAAANEGGQRVDPPGGTRSALAGVRRGSHGGMPLPGFLVDGLHPRPGLLVHDAELGQRDLDNRRLGRPHDALARRGALLPRTSPEGPAACVLRVLQHRADSRHGPPIAPLSRILLSPARWLDPFVVEGLGDVPIAPPSRSHPKMR